MRCSVNMYLSELKNDLMPVYESFAADQHATYLFFVNMVFRRFARGVSDQKIDLPRFDDITHFTRGSFEKHVNDAVSQIQTAVGHNLDHLQNTQTEELEGVAAVFRMELQTAQCRLGQLQGYTCKICLLTASQFVVLVACGHVFCEACIVQVRELRATSSSAVHERRVKCPNCRAETRAMKLYP